MPKLYVLNVPEFKPVIDYLDEQGVSAETKRGYVCFSSHQPIKVKRQNMIDATWFGFPVGGIDGEIEEHSETDFCLV